MRGDRAPRTTHDALQVGGARGAAPHLAAGRLENSVGVGDDDHIRRNTQRRHHTVHHGRPQVLTLGGFARPGLGDDHQALGAHARVMHAEGGHAALPDARDASHDVFDLLRIQIAAGLLDQVLLPAGDEQLAVGPVAQIARIHPPVAPRRPRRARVPPVALGDRRSAELDPPLLALTQRPPLPIDHAHLVPRQGRPARHMVEGRGLVGPGGDRPAGLLERLARDRVDPGTRPGRRDSQRHRSLGEAVDRAHRVGLESPRGEPPAEPVDGGRAHRLRAVEREPPRRQIEARDLLVGDPPRAEVEGEVGRGGDRGAVSVDGV